MAAIGFLKCGKVIFVVASRLEAQRAGLKPSEPITQALAFETKETQRISTTEKGHGHV